MAKNIKKSAKVASMVTDAPKARRGKPSKPVGETPRECWQRTVGSSIHRILVELKRLRNKANKVKAEDADNKNLKSGYFYTEENVETLFGHLENGIAKTRKAFKNGTSKVKTQVPDYFAK